MKKIRNILFICYANTCRSPAAEYFSKGLKIDKYKEELKEINFDSAGWHDAFDHAQPETIDYLKSKGIDMSTFKPKVITLDLIKRQDLIIGMERYHLTKLKKNYRELSSFFKDKLFTLKEFNDADSTDLNIPDPYKTGYENYIRILKIVEKNVEQLIEKIIVINKKNN